MKSKEKRNSSRVKSTLFFLLVLMAALPAYSQIKEINPSIQWRFVNTDEFTLENGQPYSLEFPAEKDYDYIFTLEHKLVNVYAYMALYDLQNQKLTQVHEDSSETNLDFHFSVPESGNYMVVFGVHNPKQGEKENLTLTLHLIRRKKV